MPAPFRVPLNDDARTEMLERLNATRDAETRLRYQMVLLAADGRTTSQIAPLVRRSPDTVARVLKRYLVAGPAGVPHRPRPGRPVGAPPAWTTELRRVIELDPHGNGVVIG